MPRILLLLSVLLASLTPKAPGAETGPTAATDDPIKLKPFRVGTPGLDLLVTYAKDGRIAYATLARVVPGSPAEKAGAKLGMRVVKIQGVPLAGKTREQFHDEVMQQKVQDFHVLVVSERKGPEKEIRIPVSKL